MTQREHPSSVGAVAASPRPPQKLEILYYTRYFKSTLKDAIGFQPDVAEDLCNVTTNPAAIATADAVLFHIPNMDAAPQMAKRPGQLWVAMSMESDVNYPLQDNSEFMRCFDLRMNFRKDADIQMIYFHPSHVVDLTSAPRWKYRRAPCVYMASNDLALNNRYEIARELMQYLKVDSYGKSQNNRRIGRDLGRATKIDLISRYRFYFAFENSNSPDYVSEKVFDGLVAGAVPVYLGAPNIDDYLPGDNCIIKVNDFNSTAELARYLTTLSKDRKQYDRYLAWKKMPLRRSFLDFIEAEKTPALRRLCHSIIRRHAEQRGSAP